MSDKAEETTMRLIPMDPFAVARYEELRLLWVKEWMELTAAGLTNEEAWAIADERFSERWLGGGVEN